MSKQLWTVFSVQRVPKTAKSVNVGDFNTLEEAERAMVEHFNKTPKRGNFFYRISEDDLEDIGGTVMRKFTITLSNGAGSYYKRYYPEDLKSMT